MDKLNNKEMKLPIKRKLGVIPADIKGAAKKIRI